MLIQAEIWTVAKTEQGNAVLLRPMGSSVAVPIFIGQLEAQSILIGMGNVPMPRPNTHELMISLFKAVHLNLEKVEISDIHDGIFIASLLLRGQQGEIRQDSRPSDALALAVRTECPIFLADEVIDEAGIPLESLMEDSSEDPVHIREMELLRLKKSLEKSILEENYEEAARIRDLIQSMEEEPPEAPSGHEEI